MSRKSAENVERSARLLVRAQIQYLFRVSWDASLRLLSSHSSVLMLNFQNFYITKGPTTSAEKYPASTKSVRQPRPCRGETLALRQLSVATESARGRILPFLSLFEDLNRFFFIVIIRSGQSAEEETPGQLWRKHNVSDLPRTSPRCRGNLVHLLHIPKSAKLPQSADELTLLALK